MLSFFLLKISTGVPADLQSQCLHMACPSHFALLEASLSQAALAHGGPCWCCSGDWTSTTANLWHRSGHRYLPCQRLTGSWEVFIREFQIVSEVFLAKSSLAQGGEVFQLWEYRPMSSVFGWTKVTCQDSCIILFILHCQCCWIF